jgi:hypothetical protein
MKKKPVTIARRITKRLHPRIILFIFKLLGTLMLDKMISLGSGAATISNFIAFYPNISLMIS